MFGAPAIEDSEIQKVAAGMKSGWLETGPKVVRFENYFRALNYDTLRKDAGKLLWNFYKKVRGSLVSLPACLLARLLIWTSPQFFSKGEMYRWKTDK